MSNDNQTLSTEEIKRKAYTEGLKFLRSGMDSDVIYARLEKQGIPEEMIIDVIQNLYAQKKVERVEQLTPFYNVALVRIGLGFAFAIIFYLISPNQFYVPIGFIAGGILSALLIKRNMK